MAVQCIIAFCSMAVGLVAGASPGCEWGYDLSSVPREGSFLELDTDGDTVKPANWHECSGHDMCRGQRQSPIDINEGDIDVEPSLQPVNVKYGPCNGCTFKNTGHSIQMDYKGEGSMNLGILPFVHFQQSGSSEYNLLQLHFHWSHNDTTGSEHTVGHRAFPVEMHMVHARKDQEDPVTTPGGLAVLSVMFQLGEENLALQPFIEVLERDSTSSRPMDLDVSKLVPFEDITRYLTYRGSLTTPGCYETVNWVMAGTPMWISRRQLEILRAARIPDTRNKIGLNYRPTQPLNGRRVLGTSMEAFHVLLAQASPGREQDTDSAHGYMTHLLEIPTAVGALELTGLVVVVTTFFLTLCVLRVVMKVRARQRGEERSSRADAYRVDEDSDPKSMSLFSRQITPGSQSAMMRAFSNVSLSSAPAAFIRRMSPGGHLRLQELTPDETDKILRTVSDPGLGSPVNYPAEPVQIGRGSRASTEDTFSSLVAETSGDRGARRGAQAGHGHEGHGKGCVTM